jgi:hypothetical protein
MSVLELAQKYYPRLWDAKRLQALRDAGKLTAEEYEQLTGEASSAE